MRILCFQNSVQKPLTMNLNSKLIQEDSEILRYNSLNFALRVTKKKVISAQNQEIKFLWCYKQQACFFSCVYNKYKFPFPFSLFFFPVIHPSEITYSTHVKRKGHIRNSIYSRNLLEIRRP